MKKWILIFCVLLFTSSSWGEVYVKSEKDPCPADKPIHKRWCSPMGDGGYECVDCNTSYLEGISKEECEKCSQNRSFVNGYCLFNKSYDKKNPLLGLSNWCIGECGGCLVGSFNCNIERSTITTKSNCDECPNRIYQDGYCVLNEPCPDSKPLKTLFGCKGCEEDSAVLTMLNGYENTCHKCDTTRTLKGNLCWLRKSRDKERPLISNNGEEYGCNNTEPIKTEKEYCDLCPERVFIDGLCISKSTPLKGKSCKILYSINVEKKICDLCSNREYVNGQCIMKECPEKTHRIENGDCDYSAPNIAGPLFYSMDMTDMDLTEREIPSRKVEEYPQDAFESIPTLFDENSDHFGK